MHVLDLNVLIAVDLWLFEAEEHAVTWATVSSFLLVEELGGRRVLVLIDEHIRLWLEVLDLEIRCQDVLGQLLL